MMISPRIAIIRRAKKTRKYHSIRDISRRYFREEHRRFLALELLMFVVLAAAALWPMVKAAALIRTYLL
jgi:hypothetical protein